MFVLLYLALFFACSCRPVSGAYWFGLLLVGGLFMLLTVILVIISPIHAKFGQVRSKSSSRGDWYAEYFGLILVSICFYLAWGFGIPATLPLHLGVTRVILQVMFIVCNVLQGLVMVLCYCLLSEKVRKFWCRKHRQYPVTNDSPTGPAVDERYADVTMMTVTAPMHFENPVAEIEKHEVADPPSYDAVNFEFDESTTTKANVAAAEVDDDEQVKEDLTKTLEAADDDEHQVSKL